MARVSKIRSTDRKASFAYLAADEKVDFSIKPSKEFKDVIIRPLSQNVKPTVEDGVINFRIRKDGQYTIETDGHHNALHLFVNPTEGVYGKGKHCIFRTRSIAAGAIVHCSITATDKKNISII